MVDEIEEDSESESPEQTKRPYPLKPLTPREHHFVKLMAQNGMGSIEAARIAFGWRCEPDSAESQKAKDIARSKRVKVELERLKGLQVRQEEAKIEMKLEIGEINRENLREVAFKMLEKMRDDSNKAQVRVNAIKMLKKLHDPAKDVNLVWRWIDAAWRHQTAHCPCCHKDFPLSALDNPGLSAWRERNDVKPPEKMLPNRFARRMELIKMADRRRTPHKSQIQLLAAEERHILGLGAARAGKSYLLALFAALGIMLPGVEIWLLAETFERSAKEVEYLERFLRAILYPHYKKLINKIHDKKSGEAMFRTRWGSEVRVKSAKAKGSITGHALELALCAEPGWIPPDVYEELRARMSERLGRIIALGTPKGIGGFVGRLSNMTGRDPKTGKVIRWKPEDRLLSKGAPWGVSMMMLNLDPKDNPEYVQSELESARMELSDAEYASEFEGLGVTAEGAKFGAVRSSHCRTMPEEFFRNAHFVLGIDQGAKNFGGCLGAYDGKTVVPCWEFINSDEKTSMQTNLYKLREQVPTWIEYLGGDPENWRLTITDLDPPLIQIFAEMEQASRPWPTDIVTRHKNLSRLTDNWRRECQEFVNNLARKDELIFHLFERDIATLDQDASPGAEILHGQVMNCVDVPDNPERESGNQIRHKGWQVSDPFRGDHVLDAWYFIMWTIYTNQFVVIPKDVPVADSNSEDPWKEQKAAFNYMLERNERDELKGYRPGPKDERPGDLWRRYFGGRAGGKLAPGGWYGNES